MKTIYTIPAPDSLGAMIEVYGEPENAWYEWRIIDGGRTVRDTGTEGHSAFQGRQYGQCVFRFVRPPVPVSSGQAFRCDPASMI